MKELIKTIETAFTQRADISPTNASDEVRSAVADTLDLLNQGKLRVAEKINGEWIVHQWAKKAVLLNFRLHDNRVHTGGYSNFYDKVEMKYANYSLEDFQRDGVRVVPHAIVRNGAYVAKNTVLMPSYINVGAYVDEGCMIDTWATVASCAQVGKNVHISGGAALGGVLEPLQANPTIVEDNCFIGARSEIVEGVIVEENSVISMGVFIGQSTKIYDRETGEISYGRIPAGSVVVPGSLPDKSGKVSLYCAVIVKKVDAQTRSKVSINELLRNTD